MCVSFKTLSPVSKTFTLGHYVIAQQATAIAAGEALCFHYDVHGSMRGLTDVEGVIA